MKTQTTTTQTPSMTPAEAALLKQIRENIAKTERHFGAWPSLYGARRPL